MFKDFGFKVLYIHTTLVSIVIANSPFFKDGKIALGCMVLSLLYSKE